MASKVSISLSCRIKQVLHLLHTGPLSLCNFATLQRACACLVKTASAFCCFFRRSSRLFRMSWQAWTTKPCRTEAAYGSGHKRTTPEAFPTPALSLQASSRVQDCRHLVGHLERYSEVTGEDTHPQRHARRLNKIEFKSASA